MAFDWDLSQLPSSWRSRLEPVFGGSKLQHLAEFLALQPHILPPREDWFKALQLTPFDDVQVVILGQDPYHGIGQGHGLSFSVNPGVAIPPSLRNILKELDADVGIESGPTIGHGNLSSWAEQGVLLLNTVLTVAPGEANAHQGQGWEQLTDAIISQLSQEREQIVFLLWGKPAQKRAQLIDDSKHLILTAVHPSPLSAHRGFFGCRHFSQTNTYLAAHNKPQIDWQLPVIELQGDQIGLF